MTAKKKSTPISEGDIYAVPLPVNTHGFRYGAVRVLGANQPSEVTAPLHMIAVTRFIGRDLPGLDTPELLEFGDIVTCCGAFPRDTVRIGNLPLSTPSLRPS